ncbi:MAG: 3-methyl-2-oxobutanoate hydroxymethyltransferase [Blastocatellia bacterium]|nr:3-methyl-2-oxobutanoate hydroxymethyltransferase [Blastocatellia bacterium]
MSIQTTHDTPLGKKVTVHTLRERKAAKEKITALTAYDYPTARLVDEAGIDVLLVGDSLANVVLGYDTTLAVTLEDMLFCTRAVRRGAKRSLIVGDMPFGSYHTGLEAALTAAVRFVKEGGAEAVKLEGGRKRAPLIERLVDNEIPVMGHIGLTPQSVHKMGGYKVQGKTVETAKQLLEDAVMLEKAGAFALVLEGVPGEIARMITERIEIPTIGIGAGAQCDGQILVLADALGLNFGHVPRFVREYANLKTTISDALKAYAADVRSGAFPSQEETYSLPGEVAAKLKKSGVGFTS